MQISEFSFPHLHAAHEERLTVELERQRVAAERRAETDTEHSTVRAESRSIRSWWAGRSAAGPLITRGPANEPCPTCP
jgi:hypothetical protein